MCNQRDNSSLVYIFFFFFFQAEDGIRDLTVTGVQTCALPICWYGDLRRYREHAKGAGIPLGIYRQTFHAVQDYDQHVFRDPSPSELRLNTFGAMAFNAKFFNDFVYNTGAASLFTKTFNGSGDTVTNSNVLYAEMPEIT